MYRNITLDDCVKKFEDGWRVIIHNGKVIGFKKEGGAHGMEPKRADN